MKQHHPKSVIPLGTCGQSTCSNRRVNTRGRELILPCRSVTDLDIPIDNNNNNNNERDLRALTIGCRNWLFIGSPKAGPRAAVLNTLVASAARHHQDVWAYLRDVLE